MLRTIIFWGFPNSTDRNRRRLDVERTLPNDNPSRRLRLLYMVTSLSAVDTGYRSTNEGFDRFGKTLVPVVSESVQSMITTTSSPKLDVTVYLIAHYEVTPRMYQMLKQQLPPSVALHVWSNATPYGYDPTSSINYDVVMTPKDNEAASFLYNKKATRGSTITMVTRSLARQHRYVIKDLFDQCDMYVAFEDDMLIKGTHVQNYYQLTQHLYQLRSKAPKTLPTLARHGTNNSNAPLFFGPMTATMLQRIIPGFIRVEVVPSPNWIAPRRRSIHGIVGGAPNITMDYMWGSSSSRISGNKNTNLLQNAEDETIQAIDPSICCHRRNVPIQPTVEQVRFWETSINALGVRQMPDQSWVLLQAGNDESIYEDGNIRIGRFWTGQNHEEEYFGSIPLADRRPLPYDGDHINNQGGWMATRSQIVEWHLERCFGGFLPPYDPANMWMNDGIAKGTVEFWSGGIQLVGPLACNLQRIIPLDPSSFSASLLYHTSNNKQKTKRVARRFAPNNVHEFWGQLNTVRKNAQLQKQVELENFKATLRREGEMH
ncbi:hypothetical protein ACA910_014600 [Epithemia clementina (nom. ined.)]